MKPRDYWHNPTGTGSPLDPPQAPPSPPHVPQTTDPGMVGNPWYPGPEPGSIPNPLPIPGKRKR